MTVLKKQDLIEVLKQMLLIRNMEIRGEAAYQQGKVGGFYHSYMGQEAIQTACIAAMGRNNWFSASYRCHALALLLGVTPEEMMAELYGRETGNARGRGGSMHFYTDRLLGGFGIVTGQVPIATGAAFSIKYQEIKDQVSICFLGDGAVAQGSLHESLNLASLWNLPCIYIIENNEWGMGTAVNRAISIEKLAEDLAAPYKMQGYTVDGTDFFACYDCFKKVYDDVLKTSRPVLIEAKAERFRGHSISDPGLYRSKEQVKEVMERDPIILFYEKLKDKEFIDDETYKVFDREAREIAVRAMEFAENSPWPSPETLEEGVYADE